MPAYIYKGKTKLGKDVSGEVEAKNKNDAVALLSSRQIIVGTIKAKPVAINIPGFAPRVNDRDLAIFTRQFSTMIDAGLPLIQCLSILSTQTENKEFCKHIGQIRDDVEQGSTYNESLRKHPKVFSELYTNMIEAGEIGGIMDTILTRLAVYIEKNMKLKKQIKSAMVYPSVIMAIASTIVTGLLVFIIPVFADMFSDFGKELPWPTKVCVASSDFIGSWDGGGVILISLISFVIAIRQLYKTKSGRFYIDKFLLMLPVFGDIIRKVSVSKFTRTLGTLTSSGVPIVARTSGNKVVERAIERARESISEGKTISEPLGQSKVFPPMVVQMINVGESTGALDTMLSKIADFYDDEVDNAVASLTAMLEPMLMVFLGVTIGFIVVAMYLPIFEMAGSL